MYSVTPDKSKWSFKSILGSVAVLGVVVSPFLSSFKDGTNLAYKDDKGKPAICFGHTTNVKMTDKASDDQCRKYLEDDLTDAVAFVIAQTPDIINHTNILKASSHFILTSSKEDYLASPMLAQFKQGNWELGCRAFVNYDVQNRYKFRKPGRQCVQLEDGTWLCDVVSLSVIRNNEMKLCLTQNK